MEFFIGILLIIFALAVIDHFKEKNESKNELIVDMAEKGYSQEVVNGKVIWVKNKQ